MLEMIDCFEKVYRVAFVLTLRALQNEPCKMHICEHGDVLLLLESMYIHEKNINPMVRVFWKRLLKLREISTF